MPVKGWIDNPNKKLFVWFDAVIGYLSASIEWARRKGDPEAVSYTHLDVYKRQGLLTIRDFL